MLDILILGVVRVCGMLADWYARRIYPLWTGTIGKMFGMFPYSAVEFLLYALILLAISWMLYRLYKGVVKKESAVIHLKEAGENIVFGIAILFTLYTWMWNQLSERLVCRYLSNAAKTVYGRGVKRGK